MKLNRLKELRKKRNVKVADIIEYVDISQPYYYDVEKGIKRLNEDLLHKFADYYNVSVDYILGRTDHEAGTPTESNENSKYQVIIEKVESSGVSLAKLEKLLEFLSKDE